jgi:transposase
MEELLTLPDKHLREVAVTTRKTVITIEVESTRSSVKCPYCGRKSEKVHSHYQRVLSDLPLQSKKVKLVLNNKKFFCENQKCSHKTFAEPFDFYHPKATKTDRLQNMILEIAISQSSIAASAYLQKHVVQVGKSTICNLLKKTKK